MLARDLPMAILLLAAGCRGSATPPERQSAATPSTTPLPVASASDAAASADAALPVEEGDAGRPSAPEVLARGARVIVIDRGKVLAQRPKGSGPPLALGRAPLNNAAKVSATMGPFLGHADLLDVVVVESSEQGWHHDKRDVHYVIDTSGANDVLACAFAGEARSGGEYASSSTSIAIKRTSQKPLAFDVTRTTAARASQPRGAAQSTETKAVDHYEVGAASCADAALRP